MYTRDGIVEIVHKSGRKYLIHILTGEKVEVYTRLDKSKVSFIRTNVYPEEVKRIKEEMGIKIENRKKDLSPKEELEILKKMAKSYKKNFSNNRIKKVTFIYDSKEIVV